MKGEGRGWGLPREFVYLQLGRGGCSTIGEERYCGLTGDYSFIYTLAEAAAVA